MSFGSQQLEKTVKAVTVAPKGTVATYFLSCFYRVNQ